MSFFSFWLTFLYQSLSRLPLSLMSFFIWYGDTWGTCRWRGYSYICLYICVFVFVRHLLMPKISAYLLDYLVIYTYILPRFPRQLYYARVVKKNLKHHSFLMFLFQGHMWKMLIFYNYVFDITYSINFISGSWFQNIFPLANSFAKWENVRRWPAPYETQMRRIRATLDGACGRH